MPEQNQWIESKQDVQNYIDRLQYALSCGVEIMFQWHRRVDQERDERYTNQFTVSDLFPDENPVDVLRRELQSLKLRSTYIRSRISVVLKRLRCACSADDIMMLMMCTSKYASNFCRKQADIRLL